MATSKDETSASTYDYRETLYIPTILSALIALVASFFWTHGLMTSDKLNTELVWAAILVAVVVGVFMGGVLGVLFIIRKMS